MSKIYAYVNKQTSKINIIKEFVYERKILDSTFELISENGSIGRRMNCNDIRSLISGLYIGNEHVSVFMPLIYIVPHRDNNEKFLLMLKSPNKVRIMCKNIVTRVVFDYNGMRIIDVNDPEHDEFNFNKKQSVE